MNQVSKPSMAETTPLTNWSSAQSSLKQRREMGIQHDIQMISECYMYVTVCIYDICIYIYKHIYICIYIYIYCESFSLKVLFLPPGDPAHSSGLLQ